MLTLKSNNRYDLKIYNNKNDDVIEKRTIPTMYYHSLKSDREKRIDYNIWLYNNERTVNQIIDMVCDIISDTNSFTVRNINSDISLLFDSEKFKEKFLMLMWKSSNNSKVNSSFIDKL